MLTFIENNLIFLLLFSGAGFMFTSCHDYRFQRVDKGYQCAVEIAIGVGIPPPEMSIFGLNLKKNDWYDTVMSAKRWDAKEAVRISFLSVVIYENEK